MKRLIILIFVLIHSLIIYSQSKDFERACIILKNGDTLFGQIEKKSDLKLSFEIYFKNDIPTDSSNFYKPDQLKGFILNENNQVYHSVTYCYFNGIERTYTKRFAKEIFKDKVVLYKLDIPQEETNYTYETYNSYAYVLRQDTVDYTLSQREVIIIRDRDPTHSTPSSVNGNQMFMKETYSSLKKEYAGIMRYLFRDCSSAFNKIDYITFCDKDILSIIKKYNNCLIQPK